MSGKNKEDFEPTEHSEDELEDEKVTAKRNLVGNWKILLTVVCIAMSLFHIYTAMFGILDSIGQRSVHLTFALIIVYFLYPFRKRKSENKLTIIDYILILLSVMSGLYFVINSQEISERITYFDEISTIGIISAVALGILLIEATRRTIGNALVIIILIILTYGFFGHYLPGNASHRGFDFTWIMDHLFFTTSGVFSVALGVSATFIFMFVLFGKFLEHTGGGKFFIDLAMSAMGTRVGGPAKTAVIASTLMGSISGSAVANTVSTGSVTIPLMKKSGYKAPFAGAIEAVASTGGQIMPPIMGAAAFIIASYLGVPFIDVAIAAIIPAILYYLCLYFQIHFRARKENLVGIEKSKLPKMKIVLKEGALFIVPIIVIIVMLVQGFSPMRAGLFGIASVILVALINKFSTLNFKIIMEALEGGARAMLETAIACAAAGLIIGVVSLTGIGLKFSGIIINLAGESLILVLIFTMITSIILGMGLPTVAAYIVQVSLTVPALVEMGVTPIAAHLFIFYFAILANITPPVALAAFAASGIANSNPLKTSVNSIRLGLAGFIVPFMFIYANELLLIGEPLMVVVVISTAILAIYLFASAIEGWFFGRVGTSMKLILGGVALLFIIPTILTDLLAVVTFIALALFMKLKTKNRGAETL